MKAHGVFRLGRDATVRQLGSGTPVVNLALATNVRKGQEEITVWVDGSFFGTRAEAVAPYLLKGTQVAVDFDNVHLETYSGQNGPTTKLVGRVTDITLLGKRDAQGGQDQQARQAPEPQRAAPQPVQQAPVQQAPVRQAPVQQAPPPAASGFDSFDDDSDIPFITASCYYDRTTSKDRRMRRYDY